MQSESTPGQAPKISSEGQPTPQDQTAGQKLVDEIEASQAQTAESASHAAALLAMNREATKQVAVEDAATHEDWPQDRVDTVLQQTTTTEGALPTEPTAGEQLIGELIVSHEKAEEPSLAAASLALNNEQDHALVEAKKEVAIEDAATHADWPQDRVDRVEAIHKQ